MKDSMLKQLLILIEILFLFATKSFAYTSNDLIEDFEWLEPNNKVEIVIGEPYQLHYTSKTNTSKVFTSDYSSFWVHYDFNPTQHVVNTPKGYQIDENGNIIGLVEGSYAIKCTGLILPKNDTNNRLYITVVKERKEKESNNTLDTANDIYSKIRFALYNSSDIDFFKFQGNFKRGDEITFKIHYLGTREAPFGYKWATFSGTNMVGSGNLISQDQECKAIALSQDPIYLEVYYDQSCNQYFIYREEFCAEVYINGVPVNRTEKCSIPNISFQKGEIKFNCDTPNAIYHYEISCPDTCSEKITDGNVSLYSKYNIKVYATADGYNPSETITGSLYWIDGDLETDNINLSKMRGVVVSCHDGFISISGLDNNEAVSFYTIDGKVLGTQKAINGIANYVIDNNTKIVIVRIGENSIKIANN